MQQRVKIWSITDHIIGHTNQTMALASSLNIAVVEKKLKYNLLSMIPNLLIGPTIYTIKNREIFEDINEYPDIVIAAGRKTAPIARYIKRQKSDVKLIHILWPESGIKEFDLIILPQHDNRQDYANNITRIHGALSNITPQILLAAKEKWEAKFMQYNSPFIALLIGGSTRKMKYTVDHLKELIYRANNYAKELSGTLLVTTSRRTDKEFIGQIKSLIDVPNYFYEFSSDKENPYLGIIAISDAIIVTGDSISMCVDCCSAKKPVYIYCPDDLLPKKHLQFIEELFANDFAKDFIKESGATYSYKSLNNIEYLNNIINKRFL